MMTVSTRTLQFCAVGVMLTVGVNSATVPAFADPNSRTLVLRERVTATLLDGDFAFKLLKIRGYTVDVRIDGERRNLKIGEQFRAGDADCSVVFEEVLPETRIVHFQTDCP